MLGARRSFGSVLVALTGAASAIWASGCCSTRCENRLVEHAVVVSLPPTPGAADPVLSKKKGDRLLWFAGNPVRIQVSVGTKPIPFRDMTGLSGGPCQKGGDCLISCPPDRHVCASGRIAIKDDELTQDGIYYEYKATILGAARASVDPGFIIKP